MNDTPNMAQDFVLNENCATTQDQTLKEQLCQQPIKTLPQTGGDMWFVAFLLIVTTALSVYGVMKHERNKEK